MIFDEHREADTKTKRQGDKETRRQRDKETKRHEDVQIHCKYFVLRQSIIRLIRTIRG